MMKKIYANPAINVALFDGEIGTTDVLTASGGNLDDARMSLDEIGNLMVKNFTELQFVP